MAIILPKKGQKAKWTKEFDVDGNLEKYLVAKPSVQPDSPQSPNMSPVITTANINPKDYISVGINRLNGNPIIISAYELADSNGKNYVDAHKFLFQKGLYMPTPSIFMTHFKNVIEAKEGRKRLNYADGVELSNGEVEELYKHLTTNHRDVFRVNNPGAWTWLNSFFKGGKVETAIGMKSNGEFITTSENLETALNKDVFVNLDFNKQGLPNPNSECAVQNYQQGKNIRFWYPREGAVARFGADSGRANLDCDWDPSYTNDGLGVFACAEGTAVAPKT